MEIHTMMLWAAALIPAFGFLTSLFIPADKEATLSRVSVWTIGAHVALTLALFVSWLLAGRVPLEMKDVVLYESGEYRFYIDFYYDKITAFYTLVGSSISLLIARFSRFYMHMEKGYKRFFNVILLFYFGYHWTVLSGNFETLFMGWEILGISSFLLIAFYRERYLPVRNAVKVFTIYRIGDIGILAAMWASHHLWHANIRFATLSEVSLVAEQTHLHPATATFIGLALLIAAAAKSAQLPFSTWLPRAMEGPTPSSAIFYGSLSVHFGVFLLLRTYPFWADQVLVKIMVILVGLSTAIIAFFISSVQSTIKSKIAYASITQIGLIFIEVALGLETIALVHFAGNAFLRCYQLLISPSYVSYLIRDQFYHFQPSEIPASSKWRRTLFMLSLREWNLDYFLSQTIFRNLKRGGHWLPFLSVKSLLWIWTPLYGLGLTAYFYLDHIPENLHSAIAFIIALSGLFMTMKSFAERQHPRLAWLLIVFNHMTLALAVSFNDHLDYEQTFIFLSGVFISGITGFVLLHFLKRKIPPAHYDLNRYYGHIQRFPKTATGFLLATLGLMGFPITPTFLGEDLLFSHIRADQFALGLIAALSFIVAGMALIRIYARIFLGNPIEPTKSNSLTTA
jgi:NADH-quinone oxidoreductase subunit L